MDLEKLKDTAKALMAGDKGLLAMDESTQSCNKRFAKLGIPETEEMRRVWRELIITTPNLPECISGLILYDETIRQKKIDSTPFVDVIKKAGIILGIKVDGGLVDFPDHPNEKVTEGLDGLPARLAEYFTMGTRFAKWRAAFTVADGIPSQDCIDENAKRLAQYALDCQEAGIVPMVEPEVIMDGNYTLEQCRQITQQVLKTVFEKLAEKGVSLEGIILKPNMVVPGLDCPVQESVDQIADATVKLLIEVVPANVGGVAFLSGGQSSQLASARLSAMNAKYKTQLPWPLTFSYSRAIQYPALEIWHGQDENVQAAQESLYYRAKCNVQARRGEYDMESDK